MDSLVTNIELSQWNLSGFGSTSWNYGTRAVHFPTKVCQSLAWYLVIKKESVRRVDLINDFWPNSSPVDGANQLRVTLSRLRAVFRQYPTGPTLLSDRTHVSIDIGAATCDVLRFSVVLNQAKSKTGSALKQDYSELIELYAGLLLPEIDNNYFNRLRDAYQERYVFALVSIAISLSRHGDFLQAVELLSHAIEIYPFDEKLYVHLFRAYGDLDRPLIIEKIYRQFIYDKFQHFGEEPSDTLSRLVAIMLPPNSLDRIKVLSSRTRLSETPSNYSLPSSVGTYSYLDRLAENADLSFKLNSNTSRVLEIQGLPGAGKSRFIIEWFKRHLETWNVGWVDAAQIPPESDLLSELREAMHIMSLRQSATSNPIVIIDHYNPSPTGLDADLMSFIQSTDDIRFLIAPRIAMLRFRSEAIFIGELEKPSEKLSKEECLATPAVRMLFSRLSPAVVAQLDIIENAETLRKLFSQIDSLPFVIEIMASWLGAISLTQLMDRISRDRSTFLQSTTAHTITSVPFSVTVRAMFAGISETAKDLIRLAAIYDSPLPYSTAVTILKLSDDVAVSEAVSSGLLRKLPNGDIFTWAVISDYVRSYHKKSCTRILESVFVAECYTSDLISQNIEAVCNLVRTSIEKINISKVIRLTLLHQRSSASGTGRQLHFEIYKVLLAKPFLILNEDDAQNMLDALGLARLHLERYELIDVFLAQTTLDPLFLKLHRELINACQGKDPNLSFVLQQIDNDPNGALGASISIALALLPRRPNSSFVAITNKLNAIKYTINDHLILDGIQLLNAFILEDTGQYHWSIQSLDEVSERLSLQSISTYASLAIFHSLRIMARLKPLVLDDIVSRLNNVQHVSEPGIVSGFASLIAYTLVDERPDIAIDYLNISNSLELTYLRNEKTSFTLLNRSIELQLRENEGDETINAWIRHFPTTHITIGNIVDRLTSYTSGSTHNNQGNKGIASSIATIGG